MFLGVQHRQDSFRGLSDSIYNIVDKHTFSQFSLAVSEKVRTFAADFPFPPRRLGDSQQQRPLCQRNRLLGGQGKGRFKQFHSRERRERLEKLPRPFYISPKL